MKKATRQADGTVIVETMTADEEKDINDCATHSAAAKACLLYTSPSPRDQRGSGWACGA